MTLKKISYIFISLLLAVLLFSVIKSGLLYPVDFDETIHAQMSYLIATGYKPFITLYSMFSPFFHWFLIPSLTLGSFTFQSIFFGRIAMIMLFVVRFVILYILVNKIVGKKVALLFVFLFLFDPFTVFSGMQIRPDNLMLVFYSAGLCMLWYSMNKQRKVLFFITGSLFSLSFLTLVKIVPSLFIVSAVFLGYGVKKSDMSKITFAILGFIIPVCMYCLYFISQGSFPQMIQQMFVDALTVNNAVANPVPLGFFSTPNNAYIFGVAGKPAAWIYIWLLPIMAGAGMFRTFTRIIRKASFSPQDVVLLILCISAVLQYSSLFFLHSVFIQYFLPVNWLFAMFAAISIHELITIETPHRFIKNGVLFITVWLFIIMTVSSIYTNNARSTISFNSKEYYEKRWKLIPTQAPVFPMLLFRPVPHSLMYVSMSDIPSVIQKRYPAIPVALEKNKVQYLLITDYWIQHADVQTAEYINSHFVRAEGDTELWVRK